MFLIDSTMIKRWLNCREEFRRRYVENIAPVKKSIHLEFGSAVHWAHEMFWTGGSYEDALASASEHCANVNREWWTVKESNRFDDLVDALPDMIACYYNEHEPAEQEMIEEEWSHGQLCGKIDRYHDGKLYDLKTASEIGRDWKSKFRNEKLRDYGLALYDWYLRQIGRPVNSIAMEVLIKPYRDKEARYELIELNEIMAYRERFDFMLSVIVKEMVYWMENYKDMKPWPMSGTACVNKYGECDFLKLCNYEDSERNMRLYTTREEHLEVRRGN